MEEKKISIVVPIYNEEANINELYRRLEETLSKHLDNLKHEIIFVDDGSSDKSGELLLMLHGHGKAVKVIQFSRNFGQHIAIKAGLDYATGDYVAIMDADLQDDPDTLKKLYEKISEGYDLVLGVREKRKDSFFKKITSRYFFLVMNSMSKIKMQPNQAMIRIFNSKVLAALKSMNELHQNNGAFIAWLGFKQATCTVPHNTRLGGRTKYNFYKSIQFATEAIMSFSNKPLIYISIFGMLVSVISIAYSGYIIYQRLFNNIGLIGWASTVALMSFFSGMILFAIGIVGLYIGKMYQQSLNRPLYVIKDKFE